MKISKRLHSALGTELLRLPVMSSARANEKRRDIGELKQVTVSNMISSTGINPDEPLIFCGSQNRAFPVTDMLTRMTAKPFLLVGTQRDFQDSSMLALMPAWSETQIRRQLPEGSGMLTLQPGPETSILLKDSIPSWSSHFLILCLGCGLQLDAETLNLLNSHGSYLLVTDSLHRSIRSTDGNRLSATDLLRCMDVVMVSSAGCGIKEVVEILPAYEAQAITNTIDFSAFMDAPGYAADHRRRDGRGWRLGQSRSVETKPVITQSELLRLQAYGAMFVYNARLGRSWIVRIM